MQGKFMPRYSLVTFAVLAATISAGCGHPATPSAAPASAPTAAVPAPAVSPQNQQNKQGFIARMKQAQMRRAQEMPQKP